MKYTLKELESLPTLSVGQADDLKIENDDTRVWLSRMTTADGMEYDNMVTIELLIDGRWITVKEYQAE